MSKKPMRDRMPTVSAWIDDLRASLGPEAVVPSIYAGTHGEPDQFHATEGPHQVGTPFTESDQWVRPNE